VFRLQLGEIGFEETWASIGGLGTDFAKSTAAVFVTGRVVHGPVICGSIGLVDSQKHTEITKPFVKLILSPVCETSDKAVGCFKQYLRSADNHSAYRSAKDKSSSEGVEGHLVVGFPLVKVALRDEFGCGLVVHDEQGAVEGDDAIEMAAEEVGVGGFGPVVEGEFEGELNRRGVVGFDVGQRGIVGTMLIKVINHKADKIRSCAVAVVVVKGGIVPSASEESRNTVDQCIFMVLALGSGELVVLERGVVFGPETEGGGFTASGPAF
jgi:hypothetical protein